MARVALQIVSASDVIFLLSWVIGVLCGKGSFPQVSPLVLGIGSEMVRLVLLNGSVVAIPTDFLLILVAVVVAVTPG